MQRFQDKESSSKHIIWYYRDTSTSSPHSLFAVKISSEQNEAFDVIIIRMLVVQ